MIHVQTILRGLEVEMVGHKQLTDATKHSHLSSVAFLCVLHVLHVCVLSISALFAHGVVPGKHQCSQFDREQGDAPTVPGLDVCTALLSQTVMSITTS